MTEPEIQEAALKTCPMEKIEKGWHAQIPANKLCVYCLDIADAIRSAVDQERERNAQRIIDVAEQWRGDRVHAAWFADGLAEAIRKGARQ